MSEHTPTTDVVRAGYVEGVEHDCYYEGDVKTTPDGLYGGEMFDRWLAEVERAAAEKAYERGRLDERHDCERYGEYERGEITGPQLRDSLRELYPYRRNEGEKP
ncbi:hypothetical protein ACFSWE_15615 [Leucobacter albus]|uniref:Antitoxin VbhA domain-containing protein n=1 Tax=Leucobacter albus TaxID=272210 RepID=A0ABW3TSN0_9MICO